jgi:hypothetical protein
VAEQVAKTKTKRLSKSARIHQRRLKQAGRKPGGALALQMVKAAEAAKATKKKQNTEQAPSAAGSSAGKPNELAEQPASA